MNKTKTKSKHTEELQIRTTKENAHSNYDVDYKIFEKS